jgi:hypothetical protein
MSVAVVSPALNELFERLVAAVPAENLPVLEKTGISLEQAYREAAEKLEREVAALELFAATEEMARELERKWQIAADYKGSAGLLEWVKSDTVQWRPKESSTALPMLLEVDDDMIEMFINMEERQIYIRLTDVEFIPFTGPFYAARTWVKDVTHSHSHRWKVIA